jgi:hypothetical protein
MKTALLISSAIAAASLATVAEARTSSSAEFRGYSTCVSAAAKDTKGLVTSRQYYVDKSGAQHRYYINATRWAEGERDYARIDCKTAARGHRLVSVNVEPGQYTLDRGQVNIEIAKN